MHQRLHPVEVVKSRILRAGSEDLDAEFAQSTDHRPGLDPAGEEDAALPFQPRLVGGDGGAALRLLLGKEGLDALGHDRIAVQRIEFTGDIA
jgi:hypothetical protein